MPESILQSQPAAAALPETAGEPPEMPRKKRREGLRAMLFSNLYGFRRPGLARKALGQRRRRASASARMAWVLMWAALVFGVATYAALTSAPPFGHDDPNTVFWLLNVDLIVMLALVTLIARRIAGLWSGRRKGIAGSRLHMRLVFIFGFLAATPAIVMTVFSAFFFHFGVQAWFSERVRTAINESQAVAQAYLDEHQQVIRADTLAMAHDLDREAPYLVGSPSAFAQTMHTQALLRDLNEAVVFDSHGNIIASSGLTFSMEFETLPSFALAQAQDGDVVLMTGGTDDRVRALVKLNNFVDAYLYVGRMVDSLVLKHLADTKKAAEDYETLEGQRSGLQVTITLIFVVVAMLLLLSAIWFGLVFARQMVAPITSLISASDRVRAGDLTARVPEFDRIDEFDVLARAFNRMTSQISEQRDELISANRQLDQRRRFTEAVLAGVSLGIVGVDGIGRVTLANASAAEMFGREQGDLVGRSIAALMPAVGPVLEQAYQKPGKVTQSEIPYTPVAPGAQGKRVLLVRIAVERIGEDEKGAVLTFDDMTELQAAQRKAAWADVARRIAHEIKNPLTPIQLSAERLKRKYMKQITQDSDIFAQCTDTIIQHVGDIGRMVDEFSAFARMPEPVMKDGNLARHLRELTVFLREAHPHIRFDVREMAAGAEDWGQLWFDPQQVRQAYINIMQNAIDSIEARLAAAPGSEPGHIEVRIGPVGEGEEIAVAVSDNGGGLPETDDAAQLAEPYVTHKEKGTGLGLAIVKKIMEDHGGRLVIGNWPGDGAAPAAATVALVFPAAGAEKPGTKGAGRIEAAA
jgi:two-component system nitrogen regulation sensor histidine kinase NtrY